MDNASSARKVTIRQSTEINSVDIRIPHEPLHEVRFRLGNGSDQVLYEAAPILQVVRKYRNGLRASVLMQIGERGKANYYRMGHTYVIPGLPKGSYDIYFRPNVTSDIAHLKVDVVNGPIDAGVMTFKPLARVNGKLSGPNGTRPDTLYLAMRPVEPWSRNLWVSYSYPIQPAKDGTFVDSGPGGIPEGRYRIRIFGLTDGYYVSSMLYGAQNIENGGIINVSPTTNAALKISVNRPTSTVSGRANED